jgi:hypothetical protein
VSIQLDRDASSQAESTLGRWEEALTPHAEEIARTLAGAAGVRAPSATARGAGSKGRGTLGRGTSQVARTKRAPNACRVCGVILSIDDRGHARKLCPDCLPAFKAERTANLVGAARRTLAAMRSSEEDPAQTPEAKAKRSATSQNGPVWLGSGSVRIPGRTTEKSSYVKCCLG